jgi:O-antigen/teichoic acid export membrane protein
MGSASAASRAVARASTHLLTDAESSFRNAKLRCVSLIAYKAIADTASKGSFFVVTVVAARRLTPWAFGVFGLGTTIGWMLAVLTDFGVQMHLARRAAAQPHSAMTLLRHWWRFRVMTAAAGLLVLVITLSIARVSRALALPITLLAIVYLAAGLVEFINYFYRGLSRSDIESTLTLSQRGGTLALGLAALYWMPDVNLLALALLLPAMASLAWSLRFAMRLTAHAAAPAPDRFASDVLPIGLGIVLSALYFRVDVLLVQFWLGPDAVGAYNAVFRLVDAMRLVPAAILAVMLPRLCRTRSYRPLASVTCLLAIPGVLAAMIVWSAAEPIVGLLFGPRYIPAAGALRILALAVPLLSVNLALTQQLIGWNRQRMFAAVCAVGLVINLGLNVVLIPELAIEGAAWATVGTEACVTAGCLIALRGRP